MKVFGNVVDAAALIGYKGGYSHYSAVEKAVSLRKFKTANIIFIMELFITAQEITARL
jgi:hypothetical protein